MLLGAENRKLVCEGPLHDCHLYAGCQGCLAYSGQRLTHAAQGDGVKQGARPSDCVSGSPCPSSHSALESRPTALHASVVRPALLLQAIARAAKTLGSQRDQRRQIAVSELNWSPLTSPTPTRHPRSSPLSRFPRPYHPLRPTGRLLVVLRGVVNANIAENEGLLRTWQCSPREPEHLVRRSLRIVLTVPTSRVPSFSFLRVGGSRGFFQDSVNVEDALELSQHKAEHSRGDTKCWAEHNADVPHSHLVNVRILHNQDKVGCECTKEAVVGNGQCGYEAGQFGNPFLGIDEI